MLPDFGSFDIWANLPTILLAYAFQTTYFPVYESLRVKTDKNGIMASVISLVACFSIYVIIAVVAILAFGKDIGSDIMTNISEKPDKHFTDYILMVLFMIIAAMHIPIVLFIGKEAVLIIVDELMRRTISRAQEEDIRSLRETLHDGPGSERNSEHR